MAGVFVLAGFCWSFWPPAFQMCGIIGAGILLMRPDWGQGNPVVRFEFVIECRRVPEEINCLGDIKISDIRY